MTTQAPPQPTDQERCADFLIQNVGQRFTWQQMRQNGWDEVWLNENMRIVRAYARLSTWIIPWPSAENGYTYFATQNDDERRTGAELQFNHITTHLQEELADYQVMAHLVANRTPVDTVLLREIRNYITSLNATLAYRDNMSDVAFIRRPAGYVAPRRGPSPRVHPRLFA